MNSKIKKIQVLGSGCPTCKVMFEITKKVVSELKIDVPVEYITDIAKMVQMGLMQSPALAINDRPVLAGGFSEEDIKRILQENI